jgi:hypothetical protein
MRRLMMQLFATVFGLSVCSGVTLHAQTTEWTRSLEMGESTLGRGVSVDGLGNVYLTGSFYLNADPNTRTWEAFVSKYDAAGNQVWVRELGSNDQQDGSFEVSADSLGNVFIATEGGARLAMYDSSGDLAWVRPVPAMGAPHSVSNSVSADGLGNAYICGPGGQDANLAKYDATGNLLWARRFGTTQAENAYAVSADSLGNSFVTGYTRGDLGGPNPGEADAFLSKYDPAGNQLWLRQFGTIGSEGGSAVAADALGNVYVAGFSDGSLDGPNAGGYDVFVRKYDGSGSLLWGRQLGSSNDDGCCAGGVVGVDTLGLAADGLGNIYLAGWTDGDLGGPDPGDETDAFVAKYDADGKLHWVEQFGTGALASDVSADGLGNIYISGVLDPTRLSAFIAKFRDNKVVPEPTSAALGLLALAFGSFGARGVSCRRFSARQSPRSR